MPSVCAIIRSAAANNGANRLVDELTPAFGGNIFVVIDRYADEDAPEALIKGHQIFIGRKFLGRRGLPWFPKVGWQCGDLVYYAAAEILPIYDYYFVVEDDVSFRYTNHSFFQRLFAFDFEAALCWIQAATEGWSWAKTMTGYYNSGVYHTFFPVSCVSRGVALHLLAERVKYTRHFLASSSDLARQNYANDEVFVASAVMHGGFACRDMISLFPSGSWEHFSLKLPIHPDELAFYSENIIHPVCFGEKSRLRLGHLMQDFLSNRAKLIDRFETYSSRLGAETWEDFSGIPQSLLVRDDNSSFVQFHILQQAVADLIESRHKLSCRIWIYERRILVFDFATAAGMVSFDVYSATEDEDYKVELFARDPSAGILLKKINEGEIPKAKLLIGTLPKDQPLASKVDLLANLLADHMLKLLA